MNDRLRDIAEDLANGSTIKGDDAAYLANVLMNDLYWLFGIYFAMALLDLDRAEEAHVALEQVTDRAGAELG